MQHEQPDPLTAAVLRTATRLTTPCGDGQAVWHAWGSPDSALPPVVLFHGGSGSWTHWVRNVQALAASGRYVLAVDLPGFGESALPPTGGDADALPAPLEAGQVDYAILVGEEMRPLADALAVRHAHVADTAAAIPLIQTEMRAGDAILVKGSNGVGLSRLVAALADAARDGDSD